MIHQNEFQFAFLSTRRSQTLESRTPVDPSKLYNHSDQITAFYDYFGPTSKIRRSERLIDEEFDLIFGFGFCQAYDHVSKCHVLSPLSRHQKVQKEAFPRTIFGAVSDMMCCFVTSRLVVDFIAVDSSV